MGLFALKYIEVRKMLKLTNTNRKAITDKITSIFLLLLTLIGAGIIILVLGIIFSKGIQPFLIGYEHRVNFWEFITGNKWIENYKDFAKSSLGVGFIIINTIYITLLSVIIVVPFSVLTALFIVKIAPKKISEIMGSVIEILASIPSVIYGLFGATFIVEVILKVNPQSIGGLSTLASVIVLAIMIFPTVTTISVTSIRAVPKTLEEASLALGATQVQTNFKIVVNAAKSGIFAGIILGVGRALGEATAVSMVAGNKPFGPTFGLFDTTRTLTTTMLQGIHETGGLLYDIKFSVALILMVVILLVNAILNFVKMKVGNIHE